MAQEEKKAKLLQAMADTCSVSKACEITRVPRRTAYNWREEDENFAKDWDKAIDKGADALEDEAVRRAHDGTEKPVFYKGAQCGVIREYSDTLLIFLLKGRRPERYRERWTGELSGPDGKPLALVYIPDNGRDRPTDISTPAEAGEVPGESG